MKHKKTKKQKLNNKKKTIINKKYKKTIRNKKFKGGDPLLGSSSLLLYKIFGGVVNDIAKNGILKIKETIIEKLSVSILEFLNKGLFKGDFETDIRKNIFYKKKILLFVFIEKLKKYGFSDMLKGGLNIKEKHKIIYNLFKKKKIISILNETLKDKRFIDSEFTNKFIAASKDIYSPTIEAKTTKSIFDKIKSKIPKSIKNKIFDTKKQKSKRIKKSLENYANHIENIKTEKLHNLYNKLNDEFQQKEALGKKFLDQGISKANIPNIEELFNEGEQSENRNITDIISVADNSNETVMNEYDVD